MECMLGRQWKTISKTVTFSTEVKVTLLFTVHIVLLILTYLDTEKEISEDYVKFTY